MTKTVTLHPDEHQRLIERDLRLQSLERAGVANWKGYAEAMKGHLLSDRELYDAKIQPLPEEVKAPVVYPDPLVKPGLTSAGYKEESKDAKAPADPWPLGLTSAGDKDLPEFGNGGHESTDELV